MFVLDFLKNGQPIPKEKKFGLNVCLIQAVSISCLLCSCTVHPPSPHGPRTARECCVHTKMLSPTSWQTAGNILLIHNQKQSFHKAIFTFHITKELSIEER